MPEKPRIRLPLSQIEAGVAGLASERWQDYKAGIFELPSWFEPALNPDSDEYRDQQRRLWEVITGQRDYSAEVDAASVFGEPETLSVALINGEDASRVGEHLISLGQVLYRSGVQRGGAALGYGANREAVALAVALSQLGVTVDLVDPHAASCDAVKQVATDCNVELAVHNEPLGFAPVDGQYDLVFFCGTFHQELEFHPLVRRLRELVPPHGRVILAGERIVADHSDVVPGAWGIRMDIGSVVTVQQLGGMELGFRRSYLAELFVRAGFVWQSYPGSPSTGEVLWVFTPRSDVIELGHYLMTPAEAATWHSAEPTGRWTTARSVLHLDEAAETIEIRMFNHHSVSRFVTVTSRYPTTIEILAKRSACIRIPQGGGRLTVECEVLTPEEGHDSRALGIFVEQVAY